MTIVAQETFTGSTGAALASWWSTGGTGTFVLDGTGGKDTVGSTTTYAVGPYAFLTGATALSDYTITCDVQLLSTATHWVVVGMGTTAGQLSNGAHPSNGYSIELAPGTSNYTFNRHVTATRTTLSTQSHTYAVNGWYRVRWSKVGAAIKCAVWDDPGHVGTPQPESGGVPVWDFSGTDAAPFNTAQKPQLCLTNGSATGAQAAVYDNLIVETTGVAFIANNVIAAGTTAVNATYPVPVGGIMAGDLLILGATSKGSAPTHPTLSGWTKQADLVHGVGTTVGAGTGPQRQSSWTKIADGGETGTVNITPGGTASNMVEAGITCYRSGTGAYDLDVATGSTSTTAATALSITADHNQNIAAGDMVYFAIAASANTNLGSSTVNATGITFSTANERVDTGTTNGDDGRLSFNDRPATAGTSSAATVATSTASTATYGGAIFIRIREASAQFSRTIDTTWGVRNSVSRTVDTTWNIRNVFAGSIATTWGIRNDISRSIITTWAVRNYLTQTTATTWDVRNAIARSIATDWLVRNFVTRSLATSWGIRNSFALTTATSWSIRNEVARSINTTWDVRNAVARSVATSWDVRNYLTADLATSWNIRNEINREILTSWNVRNLIGYTVATSWGIASAEKIARLIATTWDIRNEFSQSTPTTWNIREPFQAEIPTEWAIRGRFQQLFATSWDIRNQISRTIPTTWNSREFLVRQILTSWSIDGPEVPDITMEVDGPFRIPSLIVPIYRFAAYDLSGPTAHPIQVEGPRK